MGKILKLFLTILTFNICLLSFFGCAQMVTGPKPTAGNTLQLSVDFRDQYDAGSYKYYFIYSKQSIEFPANYYLFTPGETSVYSIPQSAQLPTSDVTANNVIDFYYRNYFSTWSDYIYFTDLESTSLLCRATNSYFPVTADSTVHDQFSRVVPVGFSKIDGIPGYEKGFSFQISLSQLRNSPIISEQFFINFIAVDGQGTIVDFIQKDIATLTNQQNSSSSGYDDPDYTINGSQDILNWKLQIF